MPVSLTNFYTMVLTKCATIFADNNWFIVRNNIITSTGKNQGCPILNYKVEQIRGFGPPLTLFDASVATKKGKLFALM